MAGDEGEVAKADLALIMEKRAAVTTKFLAMERAKDTYKEAKAAHEGEVAELMQLLDDIKNGGKKFPLFEREKGQDPNEAGVAKTTADAAAGPGPDRDEAEPTISPPAEVKSKAWRKESLAALEPYGLTGYLRGLLEDGDIFTLGQIADWTAGGRKLTEIGGDGATKAAKIADAAAAYFREHAAGK